MRRTAVVLAGAVIAWAPDAIFQGRSFAVHDLRHHHLPWRVWAAGEWLAGRVPVWAPDVANGFPLMADGQAGAFYPPTMAIFMALPPEAALTLALLLHVFWAGLGAAMLCRAAGATALGGLVGGLAFAFSGFVATHGLYLGMQNAVAWLPWLIWAALQRRHLVAALCAAMMLLAGHPQGAAIGLLMAGAVVVWRAVSERRWPLGFTLAMVAALALASPQLLATWELVGFSMRDGGEVAGVFANIGSLPPQELINGVLPRFFGFDRPGDILQTYYHRGVGYWGAGENHWEMSFFLGVPVIWLAALGLRGARMWWAMAIGAALLMLGGLTPAWWLLRQLPVISGFRFPVRFSLVLTLCVAVLAARGVGRLEAALPALRRRWALRTVALAVVCWVGFGASRVALSVGHPVFEAGLTGFFMAQVDRALPPPPDLHPLALAALPEPEPEDPALVPEKVQRILASLEDSTNPVGAQALWPVGLLLSLGVMCGVRPRRYLLGVGLVSLVYADLWSFGANYLARTAPMTPPRALPAVLEAAGRHRTTVVDRRQDPALEVELISASLGLLWGTRDVILTSPLLILRNEALLGMAGLDVGDRGAVKVERLAKHANIVNLLGVKWLLSVWDLQPLGYSFHGDFGGAKLFLNTHAMPTAVVVGCVQTTSTPWASLGDLDPMSWAIVEADTGLPECVDGADVGSARLVAESPTLLGFDVRADRPALLVQNDTWYPGWQATIDGQPAPIHVADLVFRGVAIPAGDHRVELRYVPTWRVPALALMALGAALLAGIFVVCGGGSSRRTESE